MHLVTVRRELGHGRRRLRYAPGMKILPTLLLASLACGCSTDPDVDAGSMTGDAAAADASVLDGGTDAGPLDAGPPPPTVPADGWANAVADSDILAVLEHMGMSYTNVAADPTVIIGEPDGAAVAMGDTGHYITIDFGAGEEAFDGPGDDIIVREKDFLSGGAPEPFAVSVSSDPMGPFTELGVGTGSTRFDLSDASVASARYVRVTSTRSADDIVTGLGSPEYPGAEIDAVGAYHPGSAAP